MDRYDDTQPERERDDSESLADEHETHATTGGAAAAGAVTGGVIGLAGGPIGAAIGAVGGAIIGAASERLMHSDDDRERARHTDEDSVIAGDTTLRDETVAATPRPVTEPRSISITSRREPDNGADQLPGTDPLRNDPLR